MGIPGLMSYICSNSKCCSEKKCFSSSVDAVIDGSALRYALFNHFNNIPNDGCGQILEERIISFITRLQEMNIIIKYIVFDSVSVDDKLSTVLIRRNRKVTQSIADYKKITKSLCLSAVPPTLHDQMNSIFYKLRHYFSTEIYVINSVLDADQQISSIAYHHNCVVLSNDSDMFLYNSPGVILLKDLDFLFSKNYTKNLKVPIQIYKFDLISSFLKLDPSQIPFFSVLAGADNCKIHGINSYDLKYSLSLIHDFHGDISEILPKVKDILEKRTDSELINDILSLDTLYDSSSTSSSLYSPFSTYIHDYYENIEIIENEKNLNDIYILMNNGGLPLSLLSLFLTGIINTQDPRFSTMKLYNTFEGIIFPLWKQFIEKFLTDVRSIYKFIYMDKILDIPTNNMNNNPIQFLLKMAENYTQPLSVSFNSFLSLFPITLPLHLFSFTEQDNYSNTTDILFENNYGNNINDIHIHPLLIICLLIIKKSMPTFPRLLYNSIIFSIYSNHKHEKDKCVVNASIFEYIEMFRYLFNSLHPMCSFFINTSQYNYDICYNYIYHLYTCSEQQYEKCPLFNCYKGTKEECISNIQYLENLYTKL
ncbi:hypothetical protein WA158_006900 [Blastocystis sp. Blastoise]